MINLQTIRTLIVTLLTLAVYAKPAFSQKEKGTAIHVGLLYPISNHGVHAAQYSNIFSLHTLSGVSKNEHAFSLSGVANIIKETASGTQIAGFLNRYGSGNGFQLAGFANLAKKDIHGMQLAGFLNKAGNVKGVQFAGFINIADSSDYPIGIVNIIKNGSKSIGISLDDDQTILASFRSGGRVLYGIVGLGYNIQNSDQMYAIEAGLGVHLWTKNAFTLNGEVASTNLYDFKGGIYNKSSLRILPALRISNQLEVYAGPTASHIFTNTLEGQDMIRNTIWKKSLEQGEMNAVNIGFMGGVQWYW